MGTDPGTIQITAVWVAVTISSITLIGGAAMFFIGIGKILAKMDYIGSEVKTLSKNLERHIIEDHRREDHDHRD